MAGIPERKADHVRLALDQPTTPPTGGPGFGDIHLVHAAMPEVDLEAIDTTQTFLGHRLALPLGIASMTGGYARGGEINATLARAAERHGIPMGVGSQRAALRDPALRDSYAVARREAPTAFLFANVGAPQLVFQGGTPGLTTAEVEDLAGMIRADALIVHLNPLQELVQPEGDRNAAGWAEAIARLVDELEVPVVVKETGGGVSEAVAHRIAATGAAAIDVGGRGGTSFARIEGARAGERGESGGTALAGTFADWGIPTAVSVVLAARAGLPVVATGGIRSGLDAARAIALGASLVGVARPFLQAALEGDDALDAWIGRFTDELRATMFLTASPAIEELGSAARVVTGETRLWLDALTPPNPSPG